MQSGWKNAVGGFVDGLAGNLASPTAALNDWVNGVSRETVSVGIGPDYPISVTDLLAELGVDPDSTAYKYGMAAAFVASMLQPEFEGQVPLGSTDLAGMAAEISIQERD